MSSWTYINGVITVRPMGRTNEEREYIIRTVLNHLPKVTGSERNMNTYLIRKNGHNESCSHNEFGEWIKNGQLEVQTDYIIVVNAALRDREFEQTHKEFVKWLTRFCKRVVCRDILVEIKGYNKSTIIKDKDIYNSCESAFAALFEEPSWCNDTGEVNWCEFMMWEYAKVSHYPMLLEYKYFANEENDKEVERRLHYKQNQNLE